MRIEVFAVEDTTAQVCWSGVPAGTLTLEAGPARCRVEVDGAPGAVVLEGLPAGTHLRLTAGLAGERLRHVDDFTTLEPPPGPLLSRFATFNDLHIGSVSFGTLRPHWEDGYGVPHALRCARAAIAEAKSWGAELLVFKGDLTQQGAPEEWDAVAELIAHADLPAVVIEGNHDVATKAVDGTSRLAARGLVLHQSPSAVDLRGIRIVTFPTAQWHVQAGCVDEQHVQDAVRLVAEAPGAVAVAMHHYPQRFRWPTLYPPGIPGPVAAPFLDALAAANPATIVLSGHSHRHRSHRHGPLVVTEVGSTKDFPGCWAGYAVHEGGIRQVTRRVAAPEAITWTEQGRDVLGGFWGRWAPGLRSHRNFSHTWLPR